MKKLLSVSLILVLTLSLFASCGKKQDDLSQKPEGMSDNNYIIACKYLDITEQYITGEIDGQELKD